MPSKDLALSETKTRVNALGHVALLMQILNLLLDVLVGGLLPHHAIHVALCVVDMIPRETLLAESWGPVVEPLEECCVARAGSMHDRIRAEVVNLRRPPVPC